MAASLRDTENREIFLEKVVPIIASVIWVVAVYCMRRIFGF